MKMQQPTIIMSDEEKKKDHIEKRKKALNHFFEAKGLMNQSADDELYALGHFDQGIEMWVDSEKHPYYIEALWNRGYMLFSISAYEEAIPDLEKVVKLNPDNVNANQFLEQCKKINNHEKNNKT